MKKRRAVRSHKVHRARHISRASSKKLIYGLDPDFILILGGGFLIIVLGMMILFR